MYYKKEFDIYEFEFWGGAKDTIKEIDRLGLMSELGQIIEDVFSEGATETEINDFVWFDDIMIEETLGISLYDE